MTTHHSWKKDFRHYAILAFNYQVLLDGILAALPYLLVPLSLLNLSPLYVISGLWRHINSFGWQTPKFITLFCQLLFITTPEQHWLHHQKTNLGFSDIFTFFDQPAKIWLPWLRLLRLYKNLG